MNIKIGKYILETDVTVCMLVIQYWKLADDQNQWIKGMNKDLLFFA